MTRKRPWKATRLEALNFIRKREIVTIHVCASSNSLAGWEMPEMKPKRKAPKGKQLSGGLEGELATYEKVGLFQRSVNKKTAYRYRGCLLQYQRALNGTTPTLEASARFLANLRQQGFSPNTLKVYRATLQGFHAWRGERLVFQVRIPHHAPEYIEPTIVAKILELTREHPKDQLMLRLMTDAGLSPHGSPFSH